MAWCLENSFQFFEKSKEKKFKNQGSDFVEHMTFSWSLRDIDFSKNNLTWTRSVKFLPEKLRTLDFCFYLWLLLLMTNLIIFSTKRRKLLLHFCLMLGWWTDGGLHAQFTFRYKCEWVTPLVLTNKGLNVHRPQHQHHHHHHQNNRIQMSKRFLSNMKFIRAHFNYTRFQIARSSLKCALNETCVRPYVRLSTARAYDFITQDILLCVWSIYVSSYRDRKFVLILLSVEFNLSCEIWL